MADDLHITACRPLPRRRVVEVLFDDGRLIPVPRELAEAMALAEGGRLSPAAVDQLAAESAFLLCRTAAARLMEHSPRAEGELRQALRRRRHSAAAIDRVLKALRAAGLLNDAWFAREFARERAARREGPRLIDQRLRARGIDRAVAREAMDAALPPGGELSAAAEALERWLRRDKHAGDPQRRARAAADFLLRRGFSPPIVWDLVRNHLRVEDEPPADA